MEPSEPDATVRHRSTPEAGPAIFDPDADEPATTQDAQIRLIVEEFGSTGWTSARRSGSAPGSSTSSGGTSSSSEAEHAPFARRMLAGGGHAARWRPPAACRTTPRSTAPTNTAT